MDFIETTYRNAVLIWNPSAGRRRQNRRREIETAKLALNNAGIAVSTQQTDNAGEGAIAARKAIEGGADLIIACGGDGTINDVLGGMAGSRVPLAILPGGTANVLARELGFPLTIPAAAQILPQCRAQRIALGNIGQRYFILMAGIGFDAQVVYSVSRRWKKLFGMSTYVPQALRQLFSQPLHPFVLISGRRRLRATFACIARAQYYGPFRLIREASLLSDQFYVYAFASSNPLRYFSYTAALLMRRQSRLPDFTGFPAREIRCEQIPSNGTKTFLQVDGEFAGELPCTISIVPDALTLLMPPAQDYA